MVDHAQVAAGVVERLRSICLALPQVREEQAWAGTRWTVRGKNFAHVVAIAGGWPPAYARAVGSDGPLTVLTFRSSGDELVAFGKLGLPFFRPVWFPDIVGLVIDEATDWTEVDELVTESYCLLAPRTLADSVPRPDPA